MTTGRAESKIVLSATDRASRDINRANSALGRTSVALDQASRKSAALGGALRSALSGDVLGAVRGLSGALGGGAAGLAGTLGLAAGGVAAVGIAVVAASVQFTRWSIEIERVRAQMDGALGPDGLARALSLASAIGGVGAESVAKLASAVKLTGIDARITVEQMRELTARGTQAGVSGDEAMQAFARAIQTGSAEALKMVGTIISNEKVMRDYAESIGKTTAELTAQDRSAAVLAAVQASLATKTGTTTGVFAKQDAQLSLLDDNWLALKATLSRLLANEAAWVVDWLNRAISFTVRWGKVLIEVAKLALLPFEAAIQGVRHGLEGLEQAAAGNLRAAAESLGKAVATPMTGMLVPFQARLDRIMEAVADTSVQESVRAATGGTRAALAATDAIVGSAQPQESAPEDAKPKGAGGGAAAKLAAEQAAVGAAMRAAMLAEIAAEERAHQLLVDHTFIEMDLDRQRAEMFAENSHRILEARQSEIEAAEQARQAQVDGYMAIGAAAISAADQMGAATIAIAGLQAGYAVALGLMAIAEKGYAGIPQLLAGIAASVQFARTAGSSAPSTGGAGVGSIAPAGQSVASPSTQKAAGPTVINIFGVSNTKAELGHAISRANAAAHGTGMVPA